MSIKGQGYSLTLVKGHSDFKVKCLTFGLYTQMSDSGPLGPLVSVNMRIYNMQSYKDNNININNSNEVIILDYFLFEMPHIELHT